MYVVVRIGVWQCILALPYRSAAANHTPHGLTTTPDACLLRQGPGGGGARRATEQDGFCISFPLEKCETRINLSKFKHVNLTRRSSKAKPLDRVSSIECDHISSSNSKRPAVLLLVSQKRKQFRCSSASQFLFPPDGEREIVDAGEETKAAVGSTTPREKESLQMPLVFRFLSFLFLLRVFFFLHHHHLRVRFP